MRLAVRFETSARLRHLLSAPCTYPGEKAIQRCNLQLGHMETLLEQGRVLLKPGQVCACLYVRVCTCVFVCVCEPEPPAMLIDRSAFKRVGVCMRACDNGKYASVWIWLEKSVWML